MLFFVSDLSCAQPDNNAKKANVEPRNEVMVLIVLINQCSLFWPLLDLPWHLLRSTALVIRILHNPSKRRNEDIQQIYSRTCLRANK